MIKSDALTVHKCPQPYCKCLSVSETVKPVIDETSLIEFDVNKLVNNISNKVN